MTAPNPTGRTIRLIPFASNFTMVLRPPLLTLPGFIEPLNFEPRPEATDYGEGGVGGDDGKKRKAIVIAAKGSGRNLFPSTLCSADIATRARFPMTTRREFSMLAFMNEITDKLDWNIHIMKNAMAKRWKEKAVKEAKQLASKRKPQKSLLTLRMAHYCIDELKWRVQEFENTGFIFVFNGDVVKSDRVVSDELKRRLQVAVAKLEDGESKPKDYRPQSNNTVCDLVDPSLFPLVYGTSRILRDEIIGVNDCLDKMGSGEVIPIRSEADAKAQQRQEPVENRSDQEACYSRQFQWLPCDVRVTPSLHRSDGSDGVAAAHHDSSTSSCSTFDIKCTIASYINNVHPLRHQDFYAVVEDIMAATIPLWSAALFANEDNSHIQKRINYDKVVYRPDPDEWLEENDDKDFDSDRDDGYADYVDDYHQSAEYEEKVEDARSRCLVHPEPGKFDPSGPRSAWPVESLPLVDICTPSGLQVIVKLTTIELTPDRPTYSGNDDAFRWHSAGLLNEHICATALYFYSCDNITESRLDFRQMFRTDNAPKFDTWRNDDTTYVHDIYGLYSNCCAAQEVGSVLCREGRLLTFPNTLQHRVLPFELADKTRPGCQKVLALYLVDPNLHIISTSSVPPQRMDWWREQVFAAESRLGSLSSELHNNIAKHVDFPLTLDSASATRLELVEERKYWDVRNARAIESVEFNPQQRRR